MGTDPEGLQLILYVYTPCYETAGGIRIHPPRSIAPATDFRPFVVEHTTSRCRQEAFALPIYPLHLVGLFEDITKLLENRINNFNIN